MFHFSGSRVLRTIDSFGDDPVLTGTGYPIRKSTGRGLFAAHRGLSQLITSFFACWHQGIHHVLLVAFILRYLKLIYASPPCRRSSGGWKRQIQQIVVVFNLPCMRMSKSLSVDLATERLVCFGSRFFSRAPVTKFKSRILIHGGPDRTRTYDPALIKRML